MVVGAMKVAALSWTYKKTADYPGFKGHYFYHKNAERSEKTLWRKETVSSIDRREQTTAFWSSRYTWGKKVWQILLLVLLS